MTNFSANIDRLIFAMNGTFGEKVLKPKVVKIMLESIEHIYAMQVNLAAVGNSTDNATTSTNATDTGTDTESDGAPQMVMVPSPDYMTLEMPPYGQVQNFFQR